MRLAEPYSLAEAVQPLPEGEGATWKMMVVDPDPDVHLRIRRSLTRYAFQKTRVRTLNFRDTKTAEPVLRDNADVAVLFVNIAGEHRKEGLAFVRRVRRSFHMKMVRIVLRTDHIEDTPGRKIIREYDVNLFIALEELIPDKLYVTLTSALRSYHQLQTINREREALAALNASLERQISTRTQKLRKSERQFSMILETVAFPIVITRFSDYTIRYVNNRAAYFLDMDRDTAIGAYKPAFHEPPEDFEEIVKEVEKKGAVYNREARMRSDGEERWALISAIEVTYEDTACLLSSFNDITERREMEEKLRQLAHHDELTGLHNRRAFLEHLQEEIARAERYGNPLSLLFMDLDHFKKVNDRYGHDAGDEVLKAAAAEMREMLRETDFCGRMGGEEFAILLPETDGDGALNTAERLRGKISRTVVENEAGKISTTISIGIARKKEGERPDSLLKRADKALYAAKEAGRNRTEVAWSLSGDL